MLNEITGSVPQFQWERDIHHLRCADYEMNAMQYLIAGTFDITNRYFVVTLECLSQFEASECRKKPTGRAGVCRYLPHTWLKIERQSHRVHFSICTLNKKFWYNRGKKQNKPIYKR